MGCTELYYDFYLNLKLPLYDSLCWEQWGLQTHFGIPLPVTLHNCDSPHRLEKVWQPSVKYDMSQVFRK